MYGASPVAATFMWGSARSATVALCWCGDVGVFPQVLRSWRPVRAEGRVLRNALRHSQSLIGNTCGVFGASRIMSASCSFLASSQSAQVMFLTSRTFLKSRSGSSGSDSTLPNGHFESAASPRAVDSVDSPSVRLDGVRFGRLQICRPRHASWRWQPKPKWLGPWSRPRSNGYGEHVYRLGVHSPSRRRRQYQRSWLSSHG
jgi:hypothetical protein